MELKVWVEGIQRIVCGVTNTTTCQDVVYALAHATGKTGRFTLIEKWRNSERLLAPHEHPLKILLKWGEYSSDVQFILQRTALEPRQETKSDVKFAQGQQIYGRTPTLDSHSSTTQTHNIIQKSSVMATGDNSLLRPAPNSPLQSRDIKKSLTFSGGHSSHLTAQATNENVSSSSEVGAMQGFIPQSISSPQQYPSPVLFEQSSLGSSAQSFSNRPYYKTSAPRFSSSLTRPPAPPPYELVKGNPPPPTACFRNQPLNTYGCYTSKERCSPSMFGRSPPLYASRAPIPMVGNRHPRELPPYRDPPPPPPPSHPALMKISPQGKANSQTYSSFVPDSSSVRHYMTSDSSSPNPNTCYPESSANHDGIEYNLTSSKDQIPLKLVSSIEDDIASKNVYSSGDKVKKDIKKNACETSSISSVNNHNNSSPSKRTGYNSNTSMGKQTSPMKKSTTFNNNNNKDTINSVSGDINENMIGSLSSSVEKNNRNQVSGSPLPNNMHKGSPMKGKDGERSYVKDMIKQLVNDSNKDSSHGNLEQKSEQVVVDNYYRELVRLVNQQRDKISAQLIDLTKYEAEIAFTEGYCKEEESRLNYIKAEIQRLENVTSDSPDSSSPVKYSMEELEEQLRVAQASENKTIEDIANIKIKMSTYDQQLSPMKNKICTLQEALDQEESFHERVHGEEQGAIMREIEKLQSAINQSTNQADFTQDVSQQLSQELHEADNRLTEKKNEIEKLKEAMREANMEALVMTPVEELKAPNDKTGTAKNGTSRRMKGSPRQLETAVPTSKNPHGVWV